jgi:hypothetical protein
MAVVHSWSKEQTDLARRKMVAACCETSERRPSTAASASLQLFAVFIPALRPIFHTDTLPRRDWLLVLVGTLAVLPAVEVAKAVSRSLASSLLHEGCNRRKL